MVKLRQFGLVKTNARFVAVGERYGRLVVLLTGQIKDTYRYYAICACDCGSPIKRVGFYALTSGATQSCGCLFRETHTTHGMSSSGHYGRWRGMMSRCYDPDDPAYKNYGGRGIKVCKRWHDIKKFVADVKVSYRHGLEIDRIDNDGDYKLSNVRWTNREGNSNNRRSCRNVTFKGKTQSVRQWARELSIRSGLIYGRLEAGWSPEKALTTSVIQTDDRMALARQARWGSHIKKPKPTPRVLKTVLYHGRLVTFSKLSELCGVPTTLLRKRFDRKWSVERATRL